MTGLKELFKKSSKAAAGMTIIGVSAAAVTLTALTAPGVTGMKPYAAETTATENGWSADGMYWYENGVKQGTEGRGKEIYDPESDAWYWLDAVQNGAKAVNKDVYQESWAGQYADREDGTGKWVRYDENGHMVKGWAENESGRYYFDTETGAMAKGTASIDNIEYFFNTQTGILCDKEFVTIDGNSYWYENGIRQGLEGRGKEIYDPETAAWYWLDAVQNGAKAVNKDVYQESWAGQYADREDGTGKWVRYDENGHMVKGWTGNADGKYYFDTETGAMAKGITTIDGVKYRFDEATGTLVQTADSGEDFPEHAHVYILSSIEEATCTTDGRKIYTCSCGDSYSERIAATGHEWKNKGPIRMDWTYSDGPDDAGCVSTVADVASVTLCATCYYYYGLQDEEFMTRYFKHVYETERQHGAYTVHSVDAVFDLLSCTKCGRYKRGGFAFYEYWTTVDMNHPVSVKLNEEQIKELGLVPGKDKEY